MGLFSDIFKAATKAASAPPKPTQRSAPPKNNSGGTFTFQDEGKPPATDEAGRVIVKLAVGDGAEMDVYLYDEPEGSKWLAGRRKVDDEEIERNVKVRVFDDGTDLQVISPTGIVLGNVHRRDETAPAIVHQLTAFLREERELAEASFVFEFSGRVEGEWVEDEDDNGKTIWDPQVELVLRSKMPLKVEIDSAN